MQKRNKFKIVWVDYGTACVVTDKGNRFIEVNRNLQKYPNLLKEILEHEKKHMKSDKPVDFMHDLMAGYKLKSKNEMISFYSEFPKEIFRNISPIEIHKKKNNIEIRFDWFNVIIFAMLVGLLVLFIIYG